uniref:E3 ubiquitin/ISG15 ligase TRIM25-like n=1 Tax=Erpetoichthys calabaricus TaxID=27687 RepID=A0A8C4TJ05_ERPCA
MASARPSRLVDQYTCAVCLCVIENPITILCGHSYCMKCINDYCDRSYREGVYRCPQCRRTFNSRPEFRRNSTLMDLLENFSYAGPDDVPCDVCIGRKRKASKTCLTCMASFCESHLQQHRESQVLKRHQVEVLSENLKDKLCRKHHRVLEIFCRTDGTCICSMCAATEHKHHDTVTLENERAEKQVRSGVGMERGLLREAESEKDREDHRATGEGDRGAEEERCEKADLKDTGRPKFESPPEENHAPITITKKEVLPRSLFVNLSDLKNTLQEISNLESVESSETGGLDVTDKGTVTLCRDHPDRFRFQPQVLCREALSGTRCYWEVEWIGIWADIGVAYKGIERRGWNEECHLGHNDKSWCLCCSPSRYFVRHNKMESQICTPSSNRIGVYLDCPAGSLSFYSISDTMTLLHRFNISFSEPLYLGFGVGLDSSVTICPLNPSDQ